MNWDAEGFVLAGGASRRMGRAKALLQVRGKSLLEHAAETLRGLEIPVRLVMAADQDFDTLGLPVLRDLAVGMGPMGGLLTALRGSAATHKLVLACDLPLVGSKLFLTLRQCHHGFDITAPIDATGRIHPLCAIYKSTCLGEVQRRVGSGQLKMEELLKSDQIRCRLVTAHEHGLPDWRFTNVNTPEDLAKLERTGNPEPE